MSTIQAVLFSKKHFTWLEAHNLVSSFGAPIKPVHETENYYRFRMRPPSAFDRSTFRTKKLPRKGIRLIIGRLR